MRLAAGSASLVPDLEHTVGQVLDRRLRRDHAAPVAVALSGGGDSLALLLAAAVWASPASRGLLVLTVDHRLRPQSADWTRTCAALAERLLLPFHALAWMGEKPVTGLPAAARAARHALLAEAARAAGARVILMGHTADDVLEAQLMREAGSTTPSPREWSPSPAWPQGRGLFVLRPLLGVRRADIRDWLMRRREPWIDDPANEDVGYARPRARQAVAAGVATSRAAPAASARDLALACQPDAEAGFEIPRATLRAAAPEACLRFVSAACLSAAGTGRPPRRERVERLSARIKAGTDFTASLAGARVEARAERVRFRREPGEAARGGLASLKLQAGETGVWDGRFEVTAKDAIEIVARRGAALPETGGLEARSLTFQRLLAACGVIDREPA